MKATLIKSSILLLCLISSAGIAQKAQLNYTVNLNDIADDQFKVSLAVKGLKAENNIYQFAATAPGTYQVMDIGRFVREFKAFDKKGNAVPVTQLSTNQYQLSDPKIVSRIEYHIAETWDTRVDRDVVYKMCGSSLEKDNVLINGQCVFGYPSGMQGSPVRIHLDYPGDWEAGSSLQKKGKGDYYAETYDQLVDSPILLGKLTKASMILGKAEIDIYTYSKTGLVKSDQLLESMKAMLMAADAFVGGLPVNRYTFLYHFEDESWGAWEHSYGSEYVLQEEPYTEATGKRITSIAAHEFFHVITPLNIHSEIIEKFNFVTPTPSQHLWLYEGTTEWASHIMQLRAGMISLPDYLDDLKNKLAVNYNMDTTYSLVKLSLTSYTPAGNKQYGNIYSRGALVAGLLDIRLLELSHGKKGYREVIQELLKKYGPKKAFPENDFFTVFTQMTSPEIGDFFDQWVKNANPLPINAYYNKLGISYQKEIKTGNTLSDIGAGFMSTDKVSLVNVRPELAKFGFAEGDNVVAINGEPLTLQNVRPVVGRLRAQAIGTDYTITVKRETGEVNIKGTVITKPEVKRHVFVIDPNPTAEQLALRTAWLKNL